MRGQTLFMTNCTSKNLLEFDSLSGEPPRFGLSPPSVHVPFIGANFRSKREKRDRSNLEAQNRAGSDRARPARRSGPTGPARPPPSPSDECACPTFWRGDPQTTAISKAL